MIEFSTPCDKSSFQWYQNIFVNIIVMDVTCIETERMRQFQVHLLFEIVLDFSFLEQSKVEKNENERNDNWKFRVFGKFIPIVGKRK